MALTMKQWRRAKEFTQEQMADYLGIHVNTYINWEKDPGKISVENSKKIASVLNVSIDDIVFSNEVTA